MSHICVTSHGGQQWLTTLWLSAHQVKWTQTMFKEHLPITIFSHVFVYSTPVISVFLTENVQVQMFFVAAHRLLHFIDCVETNSHSPSEFDADLIIDLCKSWAVSSGFIVPPRDAVKADSAFGGVLLSGGDRTMRPVALPEPREAVWNAGDNDGRVHFSRLTVVCSELSLSFCMWSCVHLLVSMRCETVQDVSALMPRVFQIGLRRFTQASLFLESQL